MGPIGWPELLIILLVVLVLFGTTRLAGLGKASGKAIREFKEETREAKAKDAQQTQAAAPAVETGIPEAQPPHQYPAQQPYPAQPTQAPAQQLPAGQPLPPVQPPQQPYPYQAQQPYPGQQPAQQPTYDQQAYQAQPQSYQAQQPYQAQTPYSIQQPRQPGVGEVFDAEVVDPERPSN